MKKYKQVETYADFSRIPGDVFIEKMESYVDRLIDAQKNETKLESVLGLDKADDATIDDTVSFLSLGLFGAVFINIVASVLLKKLYQKSNEGRRYYFGRKNSFEKIQ